MPFLAPTPPFPLASHSPPQLSLAPSRAPSSPRRRLSGSPGAPFGLGLTQIFAGLPPFPPPLAWKPPPPPPSPLSGAPLAPSPLPRLRLAPPCLPPSPGRLPQFTCRCRGAEPAEGAPGRAAPAVCVCMKACECVCVGAARRVHACARVCLAPPGEPPSPSCIPRRHRRLPSSPSAWAACNSGTTPGELHGFQRGSGPGDFRLSE